MRKYFFAVTLGVLSLPLISMAAPMTSIDQETFVAEESVLRTEPQKDGEGIARLKPGVRLEILSYGTSRSWVRVKTESGREGWMRIQDTSLVSRRAKPLYSKEQKVGDRSIASIDGPRRKEKEETLEDDSTLDKKHTSRITKILGSSPYVGAHGGVHWGTFSSAVFGARGGWYFMATPSVRLGALGFYDFSSHSKTAGETVLDRKEHHTFLGATAGVPWGLFSTQVAVGWDYTQSHLLLSNKADGRILTITETGGIGGTYNEHALGARIGFAYEVPLDQSLKAVQLMVEYGVGFYDGVSLAKDDYAAFPQQVVFASQIVF